MSLAVNRAATVSDVIDMRIVSRALTPDVKVSAYTSAQDDVKGNHLDLHLDTYRARNDNYVGTNAPHEKADQ